MEESIFVLATELLGNILKYNTDELLLANDIARTFFIEFYLEDQFTCILVLDKDLFGWIEKSKTISDRNEIICCLF